MQLRHYSLSAMSRALQQVPSNGTVVPAAELISEAVNPLRNFAIIFVVLWTLSLFAWLGNWLLFGFRRSVKLQQAMTIVPICAILKHGWLACFYTSLSHGYYVLSQVIGALISMGIFNAALYVTLLVIARGWTITRSSFPEILRRQVNVMIPSYLVSFWAFMLYPHLPFLFCLILVFVAVIRSIFASINLNLYRLATMLVNNDSGFDEGRVDVLLKAYHQLRSALLVYFCFDVLTKSVFYLQISNSSWVGFALEELGTLVFCTLVGYKLRMRAGYPFTLPTAREVPLISNELHSAAAPSPGSTMTVVVIQNPPTIDAAGNRVPSMSVGRVVTSRDRDRIRGSNRSHSTASNVVSSTPPSTTIATATAGGAGAGLDSMQSEGAAEGAGAESNRQQVLNPVVGATAHTHGTI